LGGSREKASTKKGTRLTHTLKSSKIAGFLQCALIRVHTRDANPQIVGDPAQS
jgi:hypothetical protein